MVKKGATKKAKKPTPPLPPFDFLPPTVLELKHKPSEYVRCRICNISLPHLNFEWPAVPTEVSLSIIKDAICKRHGGAAHGLVLYKEQVLPINCLEDSDDGCSLKDLGVHGLMSGRPDELPELTIFYDFVALRVDDSILSREPAVLGSQHDINIRTFIRMGGIGTGIL